MHEQYIYPPCTLRGDVVSRTPALSTKNPACRTLAKDLGLKIDGTVQKTANRSNTRGKGKAKGPKAGKTAKGKTAKAAKGTAAKSKAKGKGKKPEKGTQQQKPKKTKAKKAKASEVQSEAAAPEAPTTRKRTKSSA